MSLSHPIKMNETRNDMPNYLKLKKIVLYHKIRNELPEVAHFVFSFNAFLCPKPTKYGSEFLKIALRCLFWLCSSTCSGFMVKENNINLRQSLWVFILSIFKDLFVIFISLDLRSRPGFVFAPSTTGIRTRNEREEKLSERKKEVKLFRNS